MTSMNEEDGVPNNYKIIYDWHYKYNVIGTCYVLYLSALPLMYKGLETLVMSRDYVTYWDETQLLSVFGVPFILALIGGVNFIMSRMFVRIYYWGEENSFIGVRYNGKLNFKSSSNYFMRTDQLEFKQSEVKDPKQDGTFKLRGKSFYVKDNDFKSPRYYNIFMGFDQL